VRIRVSLAPGLSGSVANLVRPCGYGSVLYVGVHRAAVTEKAELCVRQNVEFNPPNAREVCPTSSIFSIFGLSILLKN
jgi:hypothetical protein